MSGDGTFRNLENPGIWVVLQPEQNVALMYQNDQQGIERQSTISEGQEIKMEPDPDQVQGTLPYYTLNATGGLAWRIINLKHLKGITRGFGCFFVNSITCLGGCRGNEKIYYLFVNCFRHSVYNICAGNRALRNLPDQHPFSIRQRYNV